MYNITYYERIFKSKPHRHLNIAGIQFLQDLSIPLKVTSHVSEQDY